MSARTASGNGRTGAGLRIVVNPAARPTRIAAPAGSPGISSCVSMHRRVLEVDGLHGGGVQAVVRSGKDDDAVLTAGFEQDHGGTGGARAAAQDGPGVDPLSLPQCEGVAPERIVADRGQQARPRSCAGDLDRLIGSLAARTVIELLGQDGLASDGQAVRAHREAGHVAADDHDCPHGRASCPP